MPRLRPSACVCALAAEKLSASGVCHCHLEPECPHLPPLLSLPQGLGIDADYRGVLQLRNAPFVGAEAYYKMSEEACALLPAEVAVPRHPGASLLPVEVSAMCRYER